MTWGAWFFGLLAVGLALFSAVLSVIVTVIVVAYIVQQLFGGRS